MSMRAFIAVDISEETRAAAEKLINTLRDTGADVKWVRPRNLHITLKFLGNISADEAERVSARLGEVAGEFGEFGFSVSGVGAFPDIRRPRVIWMGISNGERLLRLAKDVEQAMEAEGFRPERRPFSPHITIGRTRSPRGIDKLTGELVKYRVTGFGSHRVHSINLVQSLLKKEGAEYRVVFAAPLRRIG